MGEEKHVLVTLSPARLVRSLWTIAGFFVLAGLTGQYMCYVLGHDQVFGLVALFNLDGERNLPALYSVCLLAFAALLLAVITLVKHQRRERHLLSWALLTLGFFLMSVDESWSFHERLVEPVRRVTGSGPAQLFYYAWVIPGIALVAAIGVTYLRFLSALPAVTRNAFLVAAAVYLGGAIGMETLGGAYAARHGYDNLSYALLVVVEEGMEMAGSILFIRALLGYIATLHGDVWVRLRDVPGPDAHR